MRIGTRAAVLAPLGALFIVWALWIWSTVPELTIDNVDEMINDRSYAVLSRIWAIPLAIGVVFLIASVWLAWRKTRTSMLGATYPSAIAIEVSVSKEGKRELASISPSTASAWLHVLLIDEGSVSLWTGLPPRVEVTVNAVDVRKLEYGERFERGRTMTVCIELEWNDGHTLRRLSLAPIGGGLLGNSAPRQVLTAAAVQRARELIGFEIASESD